LIGALFLSTACASSAPPQEAQRAVTEEGPFLSLVDLQLHDTRPAGPHVRGMDADGVFVILSDVEGEIPDVTDGQPGYLELNTRTFMDAREARAPNPPYVEGRMTANGFVPTSRRIKK
jgi:hypothetical protein